MDQIYDLSNVSFSNRHGIYGGAAGNKDGILLNGEYWIIKYPKSKREFDSPINMSYNTSPLSEYIGSHIYEILGIPVHDTILGIRDHKLVVACKDFCETRGQLMEMRTIKNGANSELESILEQQMHYSTTGERVNLNELLLHLDYNPILQMCDGVKERFWQTVVIDILIDNNDRNTGNWGILFDERTNLYHLAPVYDNGNSFANKTDDQRLQEILDNSEEYQINYYTGSRTAYDYNGHTLSAKKMIQFANPDLQNAICELTPRIASNMKKICQMIDDIPESFQGIPIMSSIRKDFYINSIQARFDHLITPEFEHIKDIQIQDQQQDDFDPSDNL